MSITTPTKINLPPAIQVKGKNRVTPFSLKSRTGSQPEKDSGNGSGNNINGGGGGGDNNRDESCQSRYNQEFTVLTIEQSFLNQESLRPTIEGVNAGVFRKFHQRKVLDLIENLEMLLWDCEEDKRLTQKQIKNIKDKIEELKGRLPKKINGASSFRAPKIPLIKRGYRNKAQVPQTVFKKQFPTILNIARPIIAMPKITLPSSHQVEDFFGDAAAWGVVGIGLTGEVLRRAVFGN
jgi:hypothetical protein